MPKPLRSKDKNGEPFARPPEIDACLQRLESIDAATRLQAFTVASRKSDGYVPSEALTYFLRRAHATGAKDEFKQLFGLLMKRVGQSLFASIPDSRMAGAQDIREEVMSRFAERIAKDCSGRFAMLDFFEVRFDLAFARFRKTVLRQIGPASVLTVPLSTDDNEGQDISPEVEAAAADFLGGDPQKIDDPAFRLELDAAIDGFYPEITDCLERAENFWSCLPRRRRILGLWRRSIYSNTSDRAASSVGYVVR